MRDGEGDVAFSGPVPFLPADSSYVSEGVVKAPDARPAQLGLEGLFLPWAVTGSDGVSRSLFPEAADPALELFVYTGDLGLDDGLPQSVFSLDKDDLDRVQGDDGETLRMQPGRGRPGPSCPTGSAASPSRRQGVREVPGRRRRRWAGCPSAGLVLAVVGLLGSLFVRPRRTWVRARDVGQVVRWSRWPGWTASRG